MPPLIPVLVGAVILLIAASAGAAESRPKNRKYSGGKALLVFNTQKVEWKKSKKGRMLYRTVVTDDVQDLAKEASGKLGHEVPIMAFILAVLMASEAGTEHPLVKVAVAHAAISAAKKKGKGIPLALALTQLIIPDGRFGSQLGRYASTKLSPTKEDIELAEKVVRGDIKNPAPGALQWDSPRTQDALAARGEDGYEKDSGDIAEARTAEGKKPVYLPGIDPYSFRLWKPA
jgi:hypothetical protein